MGAKNFSKAETRTRSPMGLALLSQCPVVLHNLNLGVNSGAKIDSMRWGWVDSQGSVYLGDYLREVPGCAGLKQEAWAGLGIRMEGEGGTRVGGTCDTHLPFPVHSCPEIVPKGQCSNSCGFPAPSPLKQGVGAPVATLICSSAAAWHPAPRSRSLALPAGLFWVRVAPWPR